MMLALSLSSSSCAPFSDTPTTHLPPPPPKKYTIDINLQHLLTSLAATNKENTILCQSGHTLQMQRATNRNLGHRKAGESPLQAFCCCLVAAGAFANQDFLTCVEQIHQQKLRRICYQKKEMTPACKDLVKLLLIQLIPLKMDHSRNRDGGVADWMKIKALDFSSKFRFASSPWSQGAELIILFFGREGDPKNI